MPEQRPAAYGAPLPVRFVYNAIGLSIYADALQTPETTLVQNTKLTIGVALEVSGLAHGQFEQPPRLRPNLV